jgi:hypothetical protein
MRTRTLSIGAIAVAVLVALGLSLAVQPGSEAMASPWLSSGCLEQVDDGGFESSGYWVISSTAYPAAYTSSEKHSGSHSMRLGIPPGHADQYAWSSTYQDVSIPVDAESATLSFWYKPFTDDTSGWDIQGMIIYDTYWNLLWEVLDVHSNSGVWTKREVDVSSYAGQTLRLYFYVSNNSIYQWGETSMYVDDVSLEYCSDEPGVIPTVQMAVDPREKTVTAHEGAFEVSVVVTDVVDLGAFEFDLVYDPDVVLVEDVQLDGFLGRTGRTTYSGTDDSYRLDGRFSFWAYTTPPGSDPGRDGPSGSGVLVTTFLSPIDDGTTPLELEDVLVFDTDGVEIGTELHDGTIFVEECVGDVNHDGVVDIVDAAAVAAHWDCEDGEDDCYDDNYDLNENGRIDVGDVMVVVANEGVCEGEEALLAEDADLSDAAVALMKIEPRENIVGLGDSVNVSVVIEDASDLGHFQFDLRYDPEVLQMPEDPTLGDFLGSTGRGVMGLTVERDNVAGLLTFWGISHGSGAGPDGDGVLANVVVNTELFGESSLWLENVKVVDTQVNDQVPYVQDGRVSVEGSSHYLPLISVD